MIKCFSKPFALGSGDKGGEAFKQLALPLGVIRH
jgi:hypothetical protein